MKKLIVAGALLIALLAYWVFFGKSVTLETASVSPDGMYRCEVCETSTPYQSNATVKVFRRKGSSDWELLRADQIGNDSACRDSYSVDWEYDTNHRTTKLVVFGDFGIPPYEGTTILEMPFGPEKQASSTKECL